MLRLIDRSAPATHGLPPGPRGLPVLGVAPSLARDLYEFPRRVAREYGDVVHLPVPGQTLILVSHPDHVNHVFNRHADRYWKGELNSRLGEGLGATPLPLSDGDAWKRVRRLAGPLFGHRRLAPMFDLMATAVEGRILDWRRYVGSSTPVDFESELSALTMEVLLRVMFTRKPDPDTVARSVKEFRDYARAAAVRMATWWAPAWVPRPLGARGDHARVWIQELIGRMIGERQSNPIDTPDLLNTLLQARFDDGSRLSRSELSAELFGLIFAGFETTASALGWTIALLALDPEAEARALEEVDALGGERARFEDLERLTYVRACFDEAQRLQGAPFYARSPIEDDEIAGYRIPKNSTVLTSPYTLHRDPRFWKRPDAFRPERFLTDKVNKYAYVPFNIGPRRCLGMHMANIEAVLVLATALQRYRLRVPAGFIPRHAFHVSTGMKGGCPVLVEPR